jgi:predicted site-specific integrase-resolvase
MGEASKALGVSITTLRRWEAEGRLIPEHTTGGHRRYDLAKLKPELFRATADERRTVGYARVSSHDQKGDVDRQKQVLVFAICEAHNVEMVILNQGEDTAFEEDLARDVLEIITVFSARLYGSRSRKNQKLLDGVKKAVEESRAC